LEVNRGLPKAMLSKYFLARQNGFAVKENVKKFVQFEKINLKDPIPNFGQFDIIFCRNVLIYFSLDLKKTILDSLATKLAPDGFLFLGGAETASVSKAYERVQIGEAIAYKTTSAGSLGAA
jgi:chemotaxis protein methyltransferase CheR